MGHTYFGKRRLCYTDVIDYTDFQGIGHDPLYRRYDSVFSVVRAVISPAYQHFLAVPQYVDEEDQICWHIDEWNENPEKLVDLSGTRRAKYEAIKADTIQQYRQAAAHLSGEELQILACAIKYVDDERIYCADGKVYMVAWGMTPDTTRHRVNGSIIHEFKYVKKHRLTFDAGAHGVLASALDRNLSRAEGVTLEAADVPQLEVAEGFVFQRWEPEPVGHVVSADTTFRAVYTELAPPPPPIVDTPPVEESLVEEPPVEEPPVEDPPVVEPPVVETPPKKLPWYRRFWLWLVGYWLWLTRRGGCLYWLLTALLILLLLFLLGGLLRGCRGCSRHVEENGVVPIDTAMTNRIGKVVEDNGVVRPITGEDGVLPDGDRVVAPIIGDDGEEMPIVDVPEGPSLVGNRLFLFMERDNGDLDGLARDFKLAYPGEQYSIIGFDREVKMLVIQIPENERNTIRQNINAKIPRHKFIVFDEQIYEINSRASHGVSGALSELLGLSPNLPLGGLDELDWGRFLADNDSRPGWHLDAIRLQGGWRITQGKSDVRVAVVDDGIEATHPMFAGRIADAYNVFTQDNHLSLGQGHGTHTAALAVGSADFFANGVSGVAPKCTLIPVQVFDNGRCPLSALVAGVMYAIHHDADVVNISIAPQFQGLNALPVGIQDLISKHRFNNMEVLWKRVSDLAAAKKSILVFAAGNDNILASIPPENRNNSSIVVSAVDSRLRQASFTNYGDDLDISAPGVNIASAFPRHDFRACDGTSMAAPIVTGAIALMKSVKRDLTVQQASNVLFTTGLPTVGNVPPMVQLDKALEAVKRGDFTRRDPTPPPLLQRPDSVAQPEPEDDLVQEARNVGQSGKLKVTMLWNIKADIDLHVVEPNGNEIFFSNKRSSTGGYLDVDNTHGGHGSAENVYWKHPLSGQYSVSVVYYAANQEPIPTGGVDIVVFKGDEPPQKFHISMRTVKQHTHVTSFRI